MLLMTCTTVNITHAIIAAIVSAMAGIAMFTFRNRKRIHDLGDEQK